MIYEISVTLGENTVRWESTDKARAIAQAKLESEAGGDAAVHLLKVGRRPELIWSSRRPDLG